jgi:ferredoxin/flavodoxin---NADP+ reductase
MIGLMVDGKPLVRAYSMASAPWEDHLEFLSIKVENGALTSRLRNIQVGDEILIGKKAVGSLTIHNLLPGGTLWMLGTGTGLAPFLSILHSPEVYERFDNIVVSHTVRRVDELAYRQTIAELPDHTDLGELIAGKLHYYPSVTREPFETQGRVTDHIRTGKIWEDLKLPHFDPAHTRVMLCGSEAMNAECKEILEGRGFEEGSTGEPGSYLLEKAFVQK